LSSARLDIVRAVPTHQKSRKIQSQFQPHLIFVLAAQLISDGETLIVNAGSTTFAFAASLGPRRDLTIVTNNVAMLTALPAEVVQRVYLLGGEYNMTLGSTVGSVGFNSSTISVDTTVLGVSGLTSTDGLSATLLEEASMFARMITSGRRTIVVADASKFGFNAFAQIAPLSAIDILVTDASPPAALCQALKQAKVEVIVASKLDSELLRIDSKT
jgi:DeoR family fructose operon transcriptional repressor